MTVLRIAKRAFRNSSLSYALCIGLAFLTSCAAADKTSGTDATSGSPPVVNLPPTAPTHAQPATSEPRRTEAKKNCNGELPPLPEPSVRHVPPPQLTAEQRVRQQEVDHDWARTVCQEGWQIIATTQTHSGDIIDWVTIPGPHAKPPPAPWTKDDLNNLPPGAQLGQTELEQHPELRGPPGTTPMTRPQYKVYVMGETGAKSLQEYLEKHQVMSH